MHVDVPARVASTDGVQENHPAIWLSFDLNVRFTCVAVIVGAEDDTNPLCLGDQYRTIRLAKLGNETGPNLSRKKVAVIGRNRELEFLHGGFSTHVVGKGSFRVWEQFNM